ncbi:hypothetical protein FE257_009103 [Aspergillus nanangensis]|uniref:Major facilitator superfamily (MFS) profile domain-containing protein n=1 Tax=Aspergillus nanangensis TaxID=2582783 RepID=A0AAD4GYV4_ASPNN|nr:hypothetical protein FE257_009103 [Aspergillus nanangensis]
MFPPSEIHHEVIVPSSMESNKSIDGPIGDSVISQDVNLIPGTEIMRPGDSIEGGNREPALLPEPADDPADPLNWTRAWKYTVIAVHFCYLFVSVESALSMAPMFPLLASEFHLDDVQLGLLTGACVVALGFSNFIIVPCSNIFGRRVTSMVLCIMGAATCIWQALAPSQSVLLAGRVLNGVATAGSETLLVQVVSDMLFLPERGFWTGLYFTGYFLGLFLGPVISGNIAQRFGWRSFFWLSLAMTCFNFITLALFAPETKFSRSTTAQPTPKSTLKSTDAEATHLESIDMRTTKVGTGKPSRPQFRLWQTPDPQWKTLLLRDLLTPLTVFPLPIVFWAGLNVAGPANVLLFWNLTESTVLSAAPYNFSASEVGYANFAFVVGGLIGLLTAGPFSDWIAKRATAKNNGIREAEMRLPALIPYAVVTVIGIVIGGLGYARQWPWPVILVVGYGLTGLCVTTVPTICIAYAVDSYKTISGEIMVVATVLKNTCGFVMSYWVPPLAARQGWLVPAMVEFSLTVFCVMDAPEMGTTTLETALEEEEDMLLDLSYPEARVDFFVVLYGQRDEIAELVAFNLGIGQPNQCRVADVKEWIHGSFNVCIPVYIDGVGTCATDRVLIRFPLPYKIGESTHPGNADEKLRCEAATFIWIKENCPEVPIPRLWGFGFSGGQSVPVPKLSSGRNEGTNTRW